MIVRMEQEKTNFNMSYRFTQGQETVCYAEAPFMRGRMDVDLRYADGANWLMRFDPSGGGSMRERLSFKIYDSGERVGTFVGATWGFLFNGYAYYELELLGERYELYEVGMGRKGLFLCLYQGERLLAIAEKDLTVRDYRDTYTLYLDSPEAFPVLSAALVYYDITSYGDLMELSVHSTKKTVVVCRQKDLLAKYDPNFIDRIRARDGAM